MNSNGNECLLFIVISRLNCGKHSQEFCSFLKSLQFVHCPGSGKVPLFCPKLIPAWPWRCLWIPPPSMQLSTMRQGMGSTRKSGFGTVNWLWTRPREFWGQTMIWFKQTWKKSAKEAWPTSGSWVNHWCRLNVIHCSLLTTDLVYVITVYFPVRTGITQSIPIVKRPMSEAVDSEALPYKCSKLISCLGAGRQVCGCEPLEEGKQDNYALVYHINSSQYLCT